MGKLTDEWMRGVRGQPGAVAVYRQVCEDMEREQEQWITELRAAGVIAAHPDDGWVDRQANNVQFVYPQFNDGAKVGDLIAQGQPSQHRIVRIVGADTARFGGPRWRFEQ